MKIESIRPALVILAVALLVGLSFQGSRGLYESTEGRYSLCAREMMDSGNWLEPTLLGEPHWTKPPLAYWSIASGVRLCGRNAWGARLPNALFFSLTALMVAGIGARMWDRRTGFLAGLMYATAIYPMAVAFSVNTDTLLAFWETLAVLCFWQAERSADWSAAWRWGLAMWFVFGLAFLTKGPPSLMALVPIAVYRARDPQRREKASLFGPVGLLVFLAVGMSWYLYVCARHPGLLGYFLGDEVVGRVAGNEFGRNPEWYQPFTMYLPLIVAGGGLWSWYFWRALGAARLQRTNGWRALWKGHGPALFLAAWLVPPLLVFSLSTSRMYTYLLPLFPAVMLAAAWQAAKGWQGGPLPRRLLVLAGIMLVLDGGGKAAASYRPPPNKDMGVLYRLCQADDRLPGTRLVLFQETRELGLGFYASNPVLRLGLENGVPSADLQRLFDELRQPASPSGRAIFICKLPKHQELLLATLAQAGLVPTATWHDRHWFLARVERVADSLDE